MADDAHTLIETALRARLASLPGVNGAFGFEDLPLGERDLPCVVVDLGNENYTRTLGEIGEGPDNFIDRSLQVDVLVVVDASRKEFRPQARTIRAAVVAALADVDELGVGLDTIIPLTSSPQQFASEKGAQGGFHLAFRATFVSPERDMAAITPTR